MSGQNKLHREAIPEEGQSGAGRTAAGGLVLARVRAGHRQRLRKKSWAGEWRADSQSEDRLEREQGPGLLSVPRACGHRRPRKRPLKGQGGEEKAHSAVSQ